jgi:uncharacterized protein
MRAVEGRAVHNAPMPRMCGSTGPGRPGGSAPSDAYTAIVGAVAAWAGKRPDIRGVAVVGSWARGEATAESDIDLIVLAEDPAAYLDHDAWIGEALDREAEVVRRRGWGVVTERRARLGSGIEVEFGVAPLSWASAEDVDAGTAQVVRFGCVPILDPDGRFARLLDALGGL